MTVEVVPREQGGLELLAALEREGAFSSTGLRLTDPNLSYDSYEAIGHLLGEMRKAMQWAVGDYILLGEQLFGERCYQAIEALGISEEGMREMVRVASGIPRSMRRKDLSWSHHRAVVGLTKEIAGVKVPDRALQREWLKKASSQGLSHHALRAALRASPEPSEKPLCSCCGRPL